MSYDYGDTENMIGEKMILKLLLIFDDLPPPVGGLDPVSARRTPHLVTQPMELVGGKHSPLALDLKFLEQIYNSSFWDVYPGVKFDRVNLTHCEGQTSISELSLLSK